MTDKIMFECVATGLMCAFMFGLLGLGVGLLVLSVAQAFGLSILCGVVCGSTAFMVYGWMKGKKQ